MPRKPFLVRLDPAVLTAIEAWATDDLRSVNAQIEFLLRDALAKRGIVELDAERKAAMVSNLLVVLCGERSTQPVVNAGTLY